MRLIKILRAIQICHAGIAVSGSQFEQQVRDDNDLVLLFHKQKE